MRIVVDELPSTWYECLFSYYDTEYSCNACQLSNGDTCKIIHDEKCPCLMSLDELKLKTVVDSGCITLGDGRKLRKIDRKGRTNIL